MGPRDSEFFPPTPRLPEALIAVEQGAATELVHGVLARTSMYPTVRQPRTEEGVMTIELVPRDIRWQIMGLIAFPAAEELDHNTPEPQVCIQLVHETGTSLDLVNEYMIHYYRRKYWGSQVPLLIDYADTHTPVVALNGPLALTYDDLSKLNDWVSQLPARPIIFED